MHLKLSAHLDGMPYSEDFEVVTVKSIKTTKNKY